MSKVVRRIMMMILFPMVEYRSVELREMMLEVES
jgi:hypothetical protein